MRILIATVTAGGGHLAAAAALEEAWHAARPDDTLKKIDLLTLFSPLHRKIYSDGYVQLIERAPELWGMVFAKSDDPKLLAKLQGLQRKFPSGSQQRFAKAIVQFEPDIVLCTHYLPLQTLALLREKKNGPRPFVASIVTDLRPTRCGWKPASISIAWPPGKPRRGWWRAVRPPGTLSPRAFPLRPSFPPSPTPRGCARLMACAMTSRCCWC